MKEILVVCLVCVAGTITSKFAIHLRDEWIAATLQTPTNPILLAQIKATQRENDQIKAMVR